MKSTLTSFLSARANGIGDERAGTPNYDAQNRTAIIPYDGIAMASHDYDGPDQLATVTVCGSISTVFCLAASDPFFAESTRETPIRIAANPINNTDPDGLQATQPATQGGAALHIINASYTTPPTLDWSWKYSVQIQMGPLEGKQLIVDQTVDILIIAVDCDGSGVVMHQYKSHDFGGGNFARDNIDTDAAARKVVAAMGSGTSKPLDTLFTFIDVHGTAYEGGEILAGGAWKAYDPLGTRFTGNLGTSALYKINKYTPDLKKAIASTTLSGGDLSPGAPVTDFRSVGKTLFTFQRISYTNAKFSGGKLASITGAILWKFPPGNEAFENKLSTSQSK